MRRRVLLLALLAACAGTGCDRAVRSPAGVKFVVAGNPSGSLYPAQVVPQGEDVVIRLRPGAPPPQVFDVDGAGHETPFAFERSGADTLVVPAKFLRLRLRHPSAEPIDVTRQPR